MKISKEKQIYLQAAQNEREQLSVSAFLRVLTQLYRRGEMKTRKSHVSVISV